MKLFFVLGSNPGLSATEIAAVLGVDPAALESPNQGLLLVDYPAGGDAMTVASMMARLGGTVKIGRVIDRPLSPESLSEVTQESGVARPEFGISDYSQPPNASRRQAMDALKSLIRLGMETKRLLKETGISSRFVRPQEGITLNSAAVAKNRLLESGGEFVILPPDDNAARRTRHPDIDGYELNRFGRTEAVQPFEEFSRTDYGRPARDAKQGMLPPKLARMMINLALSSRFPISSDPVTAAVWDPFCGSGTVLSEAWRLGLVRIYGSDLNPRAISDSRANLDWLMRRGNDHDDGNDRDSGGNMIGDSKGGYGAPGKQESSGNNRKQNPRAVADDVTGGLKMGDGHNSADRLADRRAPTLTVNDARRPPSAIADGSLDAIVCETFLGQPRQGRETEAELTRQMDEIGLLVQQSLESWKRLLRPGGSIVMALPAYVLAPSASDKKNRPGEADDQPELLLSDIRQPAGYRWQPLLPPDAADKMGTETTPERGGLIYGRPGQLVWREIVRVSLI